MYRNVYQRAVPIVVLLLSVFGLFAQSPTSSVESYLAAVRQGSYPPAPNRLWQEASQHSSTLATLSSYYSDTLAAVRAQAYFLAKQVGTNSQTSSVRQQAVSQLTQGLADENSGNVDRIHTYLTEFQPKDFTNSARQSVARLLTQRAAHLARLFKLAGYLGLQDQIPVLQELASTLSGRDRWAAQLALARLGDQEALASILDRAKRYPVNDDVVYELLPDLVYTRQKDALDYLVTVVQSEEKNCQSADPEGEESMLCGYRVLELLAPVIVDFPLALDESGDLAMSDYPKALRQARQWLRLHPDYQVRVDQF